LPVLPSHASIILLLNYTIIILLLKDLISREKSINRGRATDNVRVMLIYTLLPFPVRICIENRLTNTFIHFS